MDGQNLEIVALSEPHEEGWIFGWSKANKQLYRIFIDRRHNIFPSTVFNCTVFNANPDTHEFEAGRVTVFEDTFNNVQKRSNTVVIYTKVCVHADAVDKGVLWTEDFGFLHFTDNLRNVIHSDCAMFMGWAKYVPHPSSVRIDDNFILDSLKELSSGDKAKQNIELEYMLNQMRQDLQAYLDKKEQEKNGANASYKNDQAYFMLEPESSESASFDTYNCKKMPENDGRLNEKQPSSSSRHVPRPGFSGTGAFKGLNAFTQRPQRDSMNYPVKSSGQQKFKDANDGGYPLCLMLSNPDEPKPHRNDEYRYAWTNELGVVYLANMTIDGTQRTIRQGEWFSGSLKCRKRLIVDNKRFEQKIVVERVMSVEYKGWPCSINSVKDGTEIVFTVEVTVDPLEDGRVWCQELGFVIFPKQYIVDYDGQRIIADFSISRSGRYWVPKWQLKHVHRILSKNETFSNYFEWREDYTKGVVAPNLHDKMSADESEEEIDDDDDDDFLYKPAKPINSHYPDGQTSQNSYKQSYYGNDNDNYDNDSRDRPANRASSSRDSETIRNREMSFGNEGPSRHATQPHYVNTSKVDFFRGIDAPHVPPGGTLMGGFASDPSSPGIHPRSYKYGSASHFNSESVANDPRESNSGAVKSIANPFSTQFSEVRRNGSGVVSVNRNERTKESHSSSIASVMPHVQSLPDHINKPARSTITPTTRFSTPAITDSLDDLSEDYREPTSRGPLAPRRISPIQNEAQTGAVPQTCQTDTEWMVGLIVNVNNLVVIIAVPYRGACYFPNERKEYTYKQGEFVRVHIRRLMDDESVNRLYCDYEVIQEPMPVTRDDLPKLPFTQVVDKMVQIILRGQVKKDDQGKIYFFSNELGPIYNLPSGKLLVRLDQECQATCSFKFFQEEKYWSWVANHLVPPENSSEWKAVIVENDERQRRAPDERQSGIERDRERGIINRSPERHYIELLAELWRVPGVERAAYESSPQLYAEIKRSVDAHRR